MISPQSEQWRYFFTSSALNPIPKRYISLVIAASEVISYPLITPAADIMCGTRDYSSLNDISGLMFRKGDIERAFRYAADHAAV